MNKAKKLAEMGDHFLKIIAQEHQQSTAKGDVMAALFKSGALGLTGDPYQPTFDTSSKAADIIFNLMDKFAFKGTVGLSVSYDPQRHVDVMVGAQPANPKLAAAIRGAFQNG